MKWVSNLSDLESQTNGVYPCTQTTLINGTSEALNADSFRNHGQQLCPDPRTLLSTFGDASSRVSILCSRAKTGYTSFEKSSGIPLSYWSPESYGGHPVHLSTLTVKQPVPEESIVCIATTGSVHLDGQIATRGARTS